MSRLELPSQYRKLRATGDVLLRAELDLLLKDNTGHWKADTFLVDSGTEMTTMAAWLAKKMNLPVPQKATVGAIHRQTGLEIRAGVFSNAVDNVALASAFMEIAGRWPVSPPSLPTHSRC